MDNMGKLYTEEEETLIKEMYEKGIKPKEISEKIAKLGYNRTPGALSVRAGLKGWKINIPDLEGEVWKCHSDFPLNPVSNMGRIKTKNGRLLYTREHFGYLDCRINDKNGNKKSPRIHRLIAETFINNKDNKKCVNHKNGNKLDNRASNLEWVTYSENNKHAFKKGLIKQSNEWDKLTKKDVHNICFRLEKGESVTKIHKDYPIVTRRNINGIESGRNWKDISSQYNI